MDALDPTGLLRKAQLDTILDATVLLSALIDIAEPKDQQKITDMIGRLINMARTLVTE